MQKKSNWHPLLLQDKPWAKNENNIWLASTFTLQRNIENFTFPAKLDAGRRGQIISLVSKELLHSELLTKPTMIKADEIGPLEKEFLMEHFLSRHSFLQAHSGEAFILDDSGEFLTTINLEDHIHFNLIDCQGHLENAWNRLVKIETGIGKTMNLAFSRRFGFLTTNPSQCGTGFILRVFLQPSALIHTGRIKETRERISNEALMITGLHGDPKEIIGDILVIRNNYTLGLTEENIISSLRIYTTKLMVEENSTRSQLKQKESAEVKDKVSRAYGVLIHSYQIEAIEGLNAISLLKLGADLGWLKGATTTELNSLFFNCRRAHLLSKFKKEVKKEELSHKRAEFIHKALKKVKLLI